METSRTTRTALELFPCVCVLRIVVVATIRGQCLEVLIVLLAATDAVHDLVDCIPVGHCL